MTALGLIPVYQAIYIDVRNRRYAVVDKTYSENVSIMVSVVLSKVRFRVTAV